MSFIFTKKEIENSLSIFLEMIPKLLREHDMEIRAGAIISETGLRFRIPVLPLTKVQTLHKFLTF